MPRLDGHGSLLRIFISEADQFDNKPLYKAIVEMLRAEHIAGATVLKGILGYGGKSHLHSTHLLSLSQDLPVVVEAVDTTDNIQRILPKIDTMVAEGLVTVEKVEVIRYAPRPKEQK